MTQTIVRATQLMVLVLAACGTPSLSEPGRDASPDARAQQQPDSSGPPPLPDAGPPIPAACDGLGAVGEWQDITPSGVDRSPATNNFGVNAFVLDPLHPGTIYLGTSSQGFWKSTDCGANWTHIDTGMNAADIDAGRNWSLVIDPIHTDVLYTTTGYGTSSLYRSDNGGVDWTKIWPRDGDGTVATGFFGGVSIDPLDPNHLLYSFHNVCTGEYAEACLAESTDGGATYDYIHGDPSWAGGEGQGAIILGGGHWLWGSMSNGLWQTMDAGQSWQLIRADLVAHGVGQLYRAPDGTYYMGTPAGIARSPDGVDWTVIDNSGVFDGGVTSDGVNLFTSWRATCFDWDPPYQPYLTSPISDGTTWSPYPSPDMAQGGGELFYEDTHHILYSSNCRQGFYRVVTR